MTAYVARCPGGKIVAMAVANTVAEQVDAAADVRRWMKKYSVELEPTDVLKQRGTTWCYDRPKRGQSCCQPKPAESAP